MSPRLSLAARLVLTAIGGYRAVLSPLLAPSCRYAPSCSEYAEVAVQRFGVIRGSGLTVRRLLRCGPWHRGGFDPVPSAPDRRRARLGTDTRELEPQP